jgi:hypothetical protein
MPRKQCIIVSPWAIRMPLLLAGILSLFVLNVSDVTAQITFGPPASYDVSASPQSMTSADLNGDGLPDIVVGSISVGIAVLKNNGDGLPDVAFSAGGHGEGIGVMLNRGDGTLGLPTYYATSTNLFAVSLAVGAFYHDGHNHLALVEVGFFGSNPTLTIFRNQGNGTFVKAQQFGLPDGADFVISVDVNKDGFPDLVTANGNTNVNQTVSVLLNNRNGTFNYTPYYPGAGARIVAAADLNNDGYPDLVLTASFNDNIRLGVLLNNGDGTFAPPVFTPNRPLGTVVDIAIADFDGDGKMDLAVIQGKGFTNPPICPVGNALEGCIAIQRGRGDGTFDDPVILPLPPGQAGYVHPLIAIELDSNGDADLIAVDGASNSTLIHILLNQWLPPVTLGLRLSTDHGGNTGPVTLSTSDVSHLD